MGAESDDAIVVLRNPAWGREMLRSSVMLPLVVINLFNPRLSEMFKIVGILGIVVVVAMQCLAALSRIVVRADGVVLRTSKGRRYRLGWAEIDRFAVGSSFRVDVHLISGRRITVMQFRPVEDESPAATVALLEYERRRRGGAPLVEGSAAPTR